MTTADNTMSSGHGQEPDPGTRPPFERGVGLPRDPATVLTAVGVGCVVLGGLVAAVTGPLELGHGSWLAAYLVLVCGVTSVAMGQARRHHPGQSQRTRWGWAQLGSWNLGNALVIGGTLIGRPSLVDVGSVLLVAALAIALHATRRRVGSAGRRPSRADRAYRILLLVLAVSIPIGIILSHLRHS